MDVRCRESTAADIIVSVKCDATQFLTYFLQLFISQFFFFFLNFLVQTAEATI